MRQDPGLRLLCEPRPDGFDFFILSGERDEQQALKPLQGCLINLADEFNDTTNVSRLWGQSVRVFVPFSNHSQLCSKQDNGAENNACSGEHDQGPNDAY